MSTGNEDWRDVMDTLRECIAMADKLLLETNGHTGKVTTKKDLENRWASLLSTLDEEVKVAGQRYEDLVPGSNNRTEGYYAGFASAVRYIRDEVKEMS